MTTDTHSEVERKVRDHFHDDAYRFDAIYETRKGPVARFIDNWWRGVVQRRLELNVERLQPLAGKRILDVGCGSGRFCIAFANGGAKYVLGIDFAPAMIDIANEIAAKAGVAEACEFRVGTFPEAVAESEGPFDAATANGFFDYVDEPAPIIARMRELTKGKMVMSFPKAVEWRIPLRRLRFWMKGTPLFLYREPDVHRLMDAAGVFDYEIVHLDRDYLVVAEV